MALALRKAFTAIRMRKYHSANQDDAFSPQVTRASPCSNRLRCVAIGGGTGLPAILQGLRTALEIDAASPEEARDGLTGIVTVTDDGGSSGRLRHQMGILTSIIPNLLVGGIASTMTDVRAVRIYVANLLTEPGETDGYTLEEITSWPFARMSALICSITSW